MFGENASSRGNPPFHCHSPKQPSDGNVLLRDIPPITLSAKSALCDQDKIVRCVGEGGEEGDFLGGAFSPNDCIRVIARKPLKMYYWRSFLAFALPCSYQYAEAVVDYMPVASSNKHILYFRGPRSRIRII